MYGTDHRGFWYHPLEPVLRRAGVFSIRRPQSAALSPASPAPSSPSALPPPGALPCLAATLPVDSVRRGVDRLDPSDPSTLFYFFELVLTTMIHEYGLLTYADLGFVDRRPDLREIGAVHPGVVLVVEKDTVSAMAFEVARRFGVTVIILGGAPELVVVEPFVRALKASWTGPVRVIAFVDYDPDGYIVARSFADHLRFYGLEADEPAFLVGPGRFSGQELDRLSVPLHSDTPERQSVLASWLAETGGIDGRCRGIHCDHLRPAERVARAFAEVSGLHSQ